MRSKGIAIPYVVWMAIFVVVPLILVVVYAFTNRSGGFTLENFASMSQYEIGRASCRERVLRLV